MATVNTMAEDTDASELEEDQELLIEALRRHLTYVEVNATVVQIRIHPLLDQRSLAAIAGQNNGMCFNIC